MTIQDIQRHALTPLAKSHNNDNSEKKIHWAVPLALLSCVLLAFFDKISIAALFSDTHFQQAMGLNFDTERLGLLMSAFLLAYGFSSVFFSGLGDRFNPAKVLTWMMVSWGGLMLLMGFVHSYPMMLLLRILLGVAEGPLFPLAFVIIRQAFPPRLQARATMLWLLGTPVGAAIGLPMTLTLLSHFGWQSTFFFMALLSLPVMLLTAFGLRSIRLQHVRTASSTREMLDVAVERRQARRELFRHPHFWLICVFNIAFLTYLWGMNGWLPSYLILGKGIHIDKANTLTSLPFIAMLIGEIGGAWVSDRFDRRAICCFISMAGAALGLLAVLYLHTNLGVIAAMSFSMLMWGIGAPNIFALLAKATSPHISATAGGIFNGMGNFAGALAPLVMGALIAQTGNMDSGLIFLMAAAGVGCLLLLPLVKRY